MDEGRITGLDGLRGLASLIVMVHHVLLAGSLAMCAAFLGENPGQAAHLLAASPLRLVWAGHEAVRVFFVLSGFVLVLPYVQGRAFRASSYYPSRLLRLYLPAAAALVVAAALHAAVGWQAVGTWWLAPHGYPLSWHGFFREATLLGDKTETAFPLFTAIWTLKWEVLFSLALPVAVWAVARGRALRVVIVIVSLAVVSRSDTSDLRAYVPLFPLGAAAAYELRAVNAVAARAGRGWAIALLASAVLVTLPSWWPMHQHLALAIQALAATGLVVTAATGAASGLLTAAPIRWLGKRSFSLYLVHEPLIVSTAFLLGATGDLATYMVVAIPVALLGAELFYRAVERPAHRLARGVAQRWAGHPREVPVVAASS